MIEIKEALSRRQQKEFLEFPNHLYKGNPYYVPPLYLDEKKIFRKEYVSYCCSLGARDDIGEFSGRELGDFSINFLRQVVNPRIVFCAGLKA